MLCIRSTSSKGWQLRYPEPEIRIFNHVIFDISVALRETTLTISDSIKTGSPVLRTKSVTKKEMNKCMAEIYDPGGIRTRAARLISQYHNHWAKENSP